MSAPQMYGPGRYQWALSATYRSAVPAEVTAHGVIELTEEESAVSVCARLVREMGGPDLAGVDSTAQFSIRPVRAGTPLTREEPPMRFIDALYGLRRDADAPVADAPLVELADPAPAAVPLIRFLTMGGAVVEVSSHRFSTRYLHARPDVGKEFHEVDGFTWHCLGCGADGGSDGSRGPSFDYGRYLPSERDLARTDANDHANACRAMDPAALD